MFEALSPEEKFLYKKALSSLKHLALICDGDRRWAKKNGLHPSEGHKVNFLVTTPTLVEFLYKEGVVAVSYICITTENFKRSQEEVLWMLDYIETFLHMFLPFAKKEMIKIVHMGKLERLPQSLIKTIQMVEAETTSFSSKVFYVGIDYGGRDEVCRAAKRIIDSGYKGAITEEIMQQHMDTQGNMYPQPDYWIRCGGERRLSGCLLWSV
ncbi:di-trans,poly-cis-decaprenylcistransferase, partial [Candidatus Dependentiae bacterium]|nr:di-trans,poly-cis-decaprenylcistransferase [Candidatus Dependentiae bacterium]